MRVVNLLMVSAPCARDLRKYGKEHGTPTVSAPITRQRFNNLGVRVSGLKIANVSLANSHFKQPPEAEIARDSAFPSGSY